MTMKHRKRSLVVDAVRWTDQCQFSETPQWVTDALARGSVGAGMLRMGNQLFVFTKFEGRVQAQPGDWIVFNEDSGVRVIKPDDFARTYEAA